MVKGVLLITAFLLATPVAAVEKTQNTAPVYSKEISNSNISKPDNIAIKKARYEKAITEAKRWSIDVEDWYRYEELAQGHAKYDFSHLDPVHVLGIFARNEEERQKFAHIWAMHEYTRIDGITKFSTVAQKASIELVKEKGMSMIDDEIFYQGRPEFKAEQDIYDAELKPGYRLAFFVKKDCSECSDLFQIVNHRRSEADISMDIYFVGDATDNDIRTWAENTKIDRQDVMGGKITLNHDRGEAERFGAKEIPSVFIRGAE